MAETKVADRQLFTSPGSGGSTTITIDTKVASYTLVASDKDKCIRMNVATANTVDIPTFATTGLPVGSQILVTQYGVGVTTINPLSGVTLRSATGFYSVDAQYATIALLQVDIDEWYLIGGIETPVAVTPAGSDTQVQYNNAGALAGASNVGIESNNLKLSSTTTPAAPVGGLIFYSKLHAGRVLPEVIGPSGINTALQAGFHGNSVFMVGTAPGTTAPVAFGGTITTAATMSSQQTIASANRWLATYRKRFQTSTTAGNATGMRTAYTRWFIGNAAGFGGFFFRVQFGANINLNGGQKFIGMCALTSALAGDPSALLNMCGMGYDAGDANTGNWFFMYNDGAGAATKVDLGATNAARANTTHGYDLIMFVAPNSQVLYVRIVNLHNGATVLDTSYNSNIPAVNTGLAFKGEVRNGAVAAADNIEIAKVYIESDY